MDIKVNLYTITKITIEKLGCCEITKTNEDYGFFKALIKRHPDYKKKIGKGIRLFRIKKTEIDDTKYELQVKHSEGYESFDWFSLAVGYIPKPKDKLRSACREAIWKQCYSYKMNSKIDIQYDNLYTDTHSVWICNFCNKTCKTTKEIQTDHIYPFSLLIRDFIKERFNIPTKFDKDERTKENTFKFEDYQFKKEWIKYHLDHAEYQMLCKDCNKKKGVSLSSI